MHTPVYLFSGDQPFPITHLRGIEDSKEFVHTVVIMGWEKVGSKTMLTIRNSLKGETIFGQVQKGEHKIEYKVTRDNNAWNLYANWCLYIDLNKKTEESESDTSDDEEPSCDEIDYNHFC